MSDLVHEVLTALKSGELSVNEAAAKLQAAPFEDLGFAKVDHHRAIRQGTPEVIYGAGKRPEQIFAIAQSLLKRGSEPVLVTRLGLDASNQLSEKIQLFNNSIESGSKKIPYTYYNIARIGVLGHIPPPNTVGTILIATAGTSDLPVAEEAAITAEVLGNPVCRLYDVGVAGLHRLLSCLPDLLSARVIIVIAGMEGALASVVAGLVSVPVIAVPTSVGYGAAFEGLAALLSMLNACAAGVSVVNIDNGFGAAFQASKINHLEMNS